jgi:hypothetical protein
LREFQQVSERLRELENEVNSQLDAHTQVDPQTQPETYTASQTQLENQLAALTDLRNQLQDQLQTVNQTQTQIQNQLQIQPQTSLQNQLQTATQLQTQLRRQLQTATQLQMEVQTQLQTGLQQPVPPTPLRPGPDLQEPPPPPPPPPQPPRGFGMSPDDLERDEAGLLQVREVGVQRGIFDTSVDLVTGETRTARDIEAVPDRPTKESFTVLSYNGENPTPQRVAWGALDLIIYPDGQQKWVKAGSPPPGRETLGPAGPTPRRQRPYRGAGMRGRKL